MSQIVVEGELRRRWNESITDVLAFYSELCKKHGLRYFIAYGSAIGAIRHKGIIPWDDDIDVVMPRPDFERLVEICRTTDLGNYELMTPYDTPRYYMPFAKMCNKNTTLLESEEYHCVLGMYIDIFVYDGMSNDMDVARNMLRQYRKYWNRFTVASSYYSWQKIKAKLGRGEIKDLIHYFILSLNRKYFRNKFLQKIHDTVHAFDYDSCETIIKYPPGYGEREVIPKAMIEESIEVPFENLKVTIQKEYDTMLRRYFGDYMQFPPIEEQQSHHHIAYFKFDRRESYDEVIKKITARKAKK